MRWVWNALSALSLVLCIATAVVWTRTYWVYYLATRAHHDSQGQASIVAERGHLIISRLAGRAPDHGPRFWDRVSAPVGDATFADEFKHRRAKRFAGFGFVTIAEYGIRRRLILLPDWAIAGSLLLCAILCRARAIRARAPNRQSKGLCQRCAYDLRGSPARCPECGRPADLPVPKALRLAVRASAPLAAFAVCSIISIVWWSNPARGASTGPGVDSDHGIDFYPTWEAAHGAGVDRMRRIDDWGQEWYQSIWHRPDGDLLVVVFQGPITIHMFYDYWPIVALDRSLHVVRTGQVGLNGTPYQLVEIRTHDAHIPARFRGKWQLGVQWHWQRSPSDFAGMDPGSANNSGFAQNWVQWDDAGPLPHNLEESEDRTTRPAEPAGVPATLADHSTRN